MDNALELLHTSAYYGLPELNSKCRDVLAYTHATHRNRCLNLFAHIHSIEPYADLEQHCLRLLRYERTVFDQSDVWPHVSVTAAREILMSDPINCDEEDLFVGIAERAQSGYGVCGCGRGGAAEGGRYTRVLRRSARVCAMVDDDRRAAAAMHSVCASFLRRRRDCRHVE